MVEIYDIECLRMFFSYVGVERDTRKEYVWYIHPEQQSLPVASFINHLKSLKGQIGFNNLGYDYILLHHILLNEKRYASASGKMFVDSMYNFSQQIINEQEDRFKYSIPEWRMVIPQLDLFKIWHYDNKAKRTSLKALQCSMNYPDVRDMPIHHAHHVSLNQIPEIIEYNKNDVYSTLEFYNFTIGNTNHPLYKNVNKLQLRKDIQAEFGIKCLNFNDVRLGDEINKFNYLKATGLSRSDLKGVGTQRDVIDVKDCIPDCIQFTSTQLGEFLRNLKTKQLTGTKGEFSETIIYKGVKFTFGQGGIHTVDRPRTLNVLPGRKLEDRDCASMYPRTIIEHGLYPKHLGIEWLNGYIWTHDQRIVAKSEFKKTKLTKFQAINETFKLALNGGGFGKTGEVKSWQRDPLVTMFVTISNQLALLMLCERYLDIPRVNVISANTDGVIIDYPIELQSVIDNIDRQWENTVRHTLEYTNYKKFVQTSVNDYLAVKTDGEVKYKGDFEIDKELHKNNSFRIIPIALKEYLVNGVSINTTISSHSDIYDFCGRERFQSDSYGVTRYITTDHTNNPVLIEKDEQKTTRFYVSNKGSVFVKIYKESKSEELLVKDYEVTIFNQYESKPMPDYNINYNYYIKRTRKILEQVESPQMKLL